jgi:hypothetical protein
MNDDFDLGADMEMKPGREIVVNDRRGTLAQYVDQAPRQTPAFAEGITRHHRPAYDDYDLAKLHIMQMLGDISPESGGLQLFGSQICVAVFCRMNIIEVFRDDGTKGQLFLPIKEIKEDWWQHKVVLVVSTGPDAFGKVTGNPDYFKARYGSFGPPKIGDWVFMNASTGTQISLIGEGHSRPQAIDYLGREFDLFEWDGWPCRILNDDSLIGRILKPHQIV